MFDLARRVIVNLQHEVRPLLKLPSHAVTQGLRRAAGGPAADAAAREETGTAEAAVSGTGVGSVLFARRSRAVEKEQTVMNDAAVPRTEFRQRHQLVFSQFD